MASGLARLTSLPVYIVDLNDGAQRLNFRYTRKEMLSGLMITQGRGIDPTFLDEDHCRI